MSGNALNGNGSNGNLTSGNRRDFIKFVVAGAVTAGCPVDLSLLAQSGNTQNSAPTVDGEDNRICHQVRDGKVFSRPLASIKHDVVVVGGGISGLTAAYRMQHRDFLLLEKEPHWGGNAYGMEFRGSTYATGSAFIYKDEYAFSFAKEIGMHLLPIDSPDASIIRGDLIPDMWGDGLNKLPYPPIVRDGFKKFKKEMLAIDLAKRGQELFNVPFTDFTKLYPAEVREWFDCYGPSNYGAASDETAAAVAIGELQEMVAESHIDSRYTWPGGIGAMTKKLTDLLLPKFADRMQAGATIVAVVPGKEEVQVTYMSGGELKTVSAKVVIMATPKFITRRVVEGLPEKQSDAMHQIRYIPYPVVNLIFDKPVFNHGYDTWCPGNTFTDIVVADWVIRKQSGYKQKYNILTCYSPMKEEDRGSLLAETSARKIAANVLRDFQKLMPGLDVDPVEVHIYRRGHPLYMSTPGLFTQVQPLVRQPLDRVFFANTDSQGPESTANEGILAAQRSVKEAEARLAGAPMPKQTAVSG
ncbi:MAG TPA: FAD-dependent oxidoreductase [Candidatus Sulfotelmatobacter sp.]|nr:FAD-dependent oxidoreductase [Candidatus Sulfotelmatobacter sp.]